MSDNEVLIPEVVNKGAECDDCTNCLLYDFGYSNWTVEGTTVVCMERIHPEPEFDRFYGKDERLRFAEACPKFDRGEPQTMDVDQEEWDELSERGKNFWAENYGVPFRKEWPLTVANPKASDE